MLDRAGGDYFGSPTATGAQASGRLLPPLRPLADESPVKTRANWRWMLGTFLTGIAGVALIGGALYTTFDGRSALAVIPDLARQDNGYALAGVGESARGARKGDRVSAVNLGIAVKHIIHESTVTKIGSKEFIEVKPYVHMTASLSLATSELTDDLPPFDPLKLFAEAAEDGAEAPQQARVASSGEIKVTLASFVPDGQFAYPGDIGFAEAENEVREALDLSLPFTESGFADQFGDPGHDEGLVDEIVTASFGPALDLPGAESEFLTDIAKSTDSSNLSEFADKTVKVSRGDTLTSLLLANGTTPQEANAIAEVIEEAIGTSKLMEGAELRLRFASEAGAGRLKPTRVSLFDSEAHIATVGLAVADDQSAYIALDEADALLANERTMRVMPRRSHAQLYDSLFETGRKSNLPESVMQRMMRIQAYDVDFKRQVQPGDSFDVFYIADDNEGDVSGDPEILFTALTVRGETKRFYRFRTPDDGVVDFYDDEGKSAKKFLIRKPMNGGVFRSSFGMRRHPILGYRKMHTGVDWAARRGTPIVAAGNGIVEEAKWLSGYGRFTLIRHTNGYETSYAHQSAFADGIAPGVKVKQGQVIGYVGSTGLSTGPHLHYEVIVNGRAVDPMRIRVPRGRTLQGHLLAAFQREKARINWLMRQPAAGTRVAAAAAGPR
ncbi:MAG: M23 family metallopeptidase [Hyphomicrobiales bacterium]|nr:M23 family metallopeptidase [Hyphomicrobiales bacterium]